MTIALLLAKKTQQNVMASWLCFANEDKGLSKFPAGTPVTYQTYSGSTSPVAVTAGEGLLRVWCCGCTVFLPLSFLSMEVLPVDSKDEAALLMVCRKVPQSSASVDHSRWLMLQAPRDFFSVSL